MLKDERLKIRLWRMLAILAILACMVALYIEVIWCLEIVISILNTDEPSWLSFIYGE